LHLLHVQPLVANGILWVSDPRLDLNGLRETIQTITTALFTRVGHTSYKLQLQQESAVGAYYRELNSRHPCFNKNNVSTTLIQQAVLC
jgi:hypothetical protein